METINERFAQIIEDKMKEFGDSKKTDFARRMGTTSQNLLNISTPGKSVGIAPITRFLEMFPDVDARWLILGDPYRVGELKSAIMDKINYLLSIEPYIPAMSKEEIDDLIQTLRDNKIPIIDSYKFQAWEAILKNKGQTVEARVADAMKKGICKTKKAKE